tara:strand:- start:41 stop:922 length:882 start_codon:yes stop_codon:yes gene_type:complete
MSSSLIRAFAGLALLLLASAQPLQAQNQPSAEIPEIPAAPENQPKVQLYEADYGNNITITGTAEYIYATADLLDSLAELPSGAAILQELGQSGQTTRIAAIPTEGDYAAIGPHARPTDLESALYSQDGIVLEPNSGSDALVFMDPNYQLAGFTPEIVMGHELLHALHFHEGEFNNHRQVTPGTGTETMVEEFRAIGTFGFDDEALSENRLRAEWNQLHPDRPVPLERNGHGALDFGPSRRPETAPARSPRPLARPEGPLQTSPRPRARPQAGKGQQTREGASQILQRALRGGN